MTTASWTPSPKNASGYVYFVAPTSLAAVKIGSTTVTVEHRVSQLQTAHFDELLVLRSERVDDAAKAEKKYHKQFAQYRLKGEWFEADPVLDHLRYPPDGFEFCKHRYPYQGFFSAHDATLKRVLEDTYRKLTSAQNDLSAAEARLGRAAQEIAHLRKELTPWITRDEMQLIELKWRTGSLVVHPTRLAA